MGWKRTVAVAVLAVGALGALTACDPSAPAPTSSASDSPSAEPTPSDTETDPPSPPAAADLALSAEGLGTLVFGEAPDTDPATAMIVFDATVCTDERTGLDAGIEEGDPYAGLWLPIPTYRDPGSDYGAWGVWVDDSATLARIDLYDDRTPTDEGIRIGDTVDDVLAAYPGATLVEELLTDIYVVTGTTGTLQIEVASQPDDMVYWEDGQVDHVMYIHAARLDIPPFTVAASENIVGICSIA
jgi:hypothetical protein